LHSHAGDPELFPRLLEAFQEAKKLEFFSRQAPPKPIEQQKRGAPRDRSRVRPVQIIFKKLKKNLVRP
jgi:hypothetical protein